MLCSLTEMNFWGCLDVAETWQRFCLRKKHKHTRILSIRLCFVQASPSVTSSSTSIWIPDGSSVHIAVAFLGNTVQRFFPLFSAWQRARPDTTARWTEVSTRAFSN
eukprot:GABV01013480.1.p2 GENE.GABV01013480.1~~GABV01013480.1.p2  ORF type:complete len:106 (-),score=16.79 GABV01013480.1:11-328(-)